MVFERRAFGSLLTAFDQIYNVQSRVDAERFAIAITLKERGLGGNT